jgi:hypothetical protein
MRYLQKQWKQKTARQIPRGQAELTFHDTPLLTMVIRTPATLSHVSEESIGGQ